MAKPQQTAERFGVGLSAVLGALHAYTAEESSPIRDDNQADTDEKWAHRNDELAHKLTGTISRSRKSWCRSQNVNYVLYAVH